MKRTFSPQGAAKKVFLIVDHLSVHEAAAVDEWLADKTDRIEVFYLPKYAPSYAPDPQFRAG